MAQQAVERQAREERTKRNPFKGTRFVLLAESVSYANALLEPSLFRLKPRRPAEAVEAALETHLHCRRAAWAFALRLLALRAMV